MNLFISALISICICLVISMWLHLGSLLIKMKESLQRVHDIISDSFKDTMSRYLAGEYYNNLDSKLDYINKHLTTEIACLATKNNEDIKRMKGDYAVGDILRFDGTRWRVFSKDTLDDGRTRWKLFGENGAEYRIYTDTIPEGIEFLGHRDLPFD